MNDDNINKIDLIAKCLNITTISPEEISKNQLLLEKYKFENGYSIILLKISIDNKYSNDIRLNSAIQLKNFINNNFEKLSNKNLNDINFVKTNIIDCISISIENNNKKLLKMFLQCLKKLIFLYFENDLNFKKLIIDKIKNNIESKNKNLIICGILCFYQLSKKYEYIIEENEGLIEYNNIFDNFYNNFIYFIENCNDFNNNYQNLILYKLFRIFIKSFYFKIPNCFKNNKIIIEKWIYKLISIIKINFDNNNDKENILIFNKLKKLSFNILYQLYQKSNIKYRYSKEDCVVIDYIKNYYNLIFESFVEIYLNNNNDLYNENNGIIYKFFNELFKHKLYNKELIKLFSNNLNKEKLIRDSILSEKDIEYWFDSPKTYIVNKKVDIAFFKKQRILCINFIQTLIEYNENNNNKKDNNIFKEYLLFFYESLKICDNKIELEYNNNNNKINDNDNLNKYKINKYYLLKESILFILENIKDLIKKYYINDIIIIIKNFVFKELDCKIGIIRERSISFINNFFDVINENNNNNNIEIIEKIFLKILNIFQKDELLQIKTISAITISNMIKLNSSLKNLFINKNNNNNNEDLKKLFELYLKLIEEIEYDDLIESINILIENFKSEMNNIIIPIIDYFSSYFEKKALKEQKYNLNNNNNEDEIINNDNLELSIILDSILKIFSNIITYFIKDDEIYKNIENKIFNIILYCLSPNGNEHLEEALSIILIILEKINFVSENLWKFLIPILESSLNSNDYEYEFIEETILIVIYYFVKDSKFFLNNYLNVIMNYFNNYSFKYKDNNEKLRYLFQIFNIMLENCKDKNINIDNIQIFLLNYINNNFNNNNNNEYKIINLIEMFSCCILYNNEKCIEFINNNNFQFFEIYLNYYEKINKKLELNRYVCALCDLIYNDVNKNNLKKYYKQIINNILNIANNKNKKIDNNNINLSNDIDDDDLEDEIHEVDDKENINNIINNDKYSIDNKGNYFNILLNNNNEEKEDEEEEKEDEEEFFYQEIPSIIEISKFGKININLIIDKTLTYLLTNENNNNNNIFIEIFKEKNIQNLYNIFITNKL